MKLTGGPAFPTLADNGHTMNQDGMTLRDWFAGKVVQAYLTASDTGWSFDELAGAAYEMADAMLKERSK